MEELVHFICPTEFIHKTLPLRSTPSEYLEIAKNNIKAEFWSILESPSITKFEVTVTSLSSQYELTRERSTITSIAAHKYEDSESSSLAGLGSMSVPKNKLDDPVDLSLSDFSNHFGVLDNKYCLLVYKDEQLKIYVGSSCYKHSTDANYFIDYGFIGDSINELRACNELEENSPSKMLVQVADPTARKGAFFIRATDEDLRRPGITPANVDQGLSIKQLRYSVEGIQGPPGTGN
jgi:hypothetical protein